jgi:hypothetical protein
MRTKEFICRCHIIVFVVGVIIPGSKAIGYDFDAPRLESR